MADIALSVLALIAGGVTLEVFAAARAPFGYQDERGFHFGAETKGGRPIDDFQTENPS